ncbi:MAG: V-type ATP synthase subunit E [Phycisphaerae bacterium]|jgi:V/A-type H+-transporting ATPase subunit E
MSANEVTGKILSEAQGQAENIKKQADEKASQETQKLRAELDSFDSQTAKLANQAAQETSSQILAQTRMEIARKSLQARNDMLEQTFAAAAEKIKTMGTQDYQQLMEKLILMSVNTGDEEIVIDKNEKRIDAAFVERLNAKLSPKIKGNLKLAEAKADIGAGFILQKGRVRVNGSLKVLLETAKENLQSELAAELFGQG